MSNIKICFAAAKVKISENIQPPDCFHKARDCWSGGRDKIVFVDKFFDSGDFNCGNFSLFGGLFGDNFNCSAVYKIRFLVDSHRRISAFANRVCLFADVDP